MRHFLGPFIALMLWCPWTALALVDINTAGLDELDTLPGVGPATAEKIVAARPFSSVGDIERVQGIGGPGTKTYEDIIGLITVDGQVSSTDDDETDVVSDARKSSSDVGGQDEKHQPVSDLKLTGPDVAYVGQVVEFSVEPHDGDDSRLVRYLWNFGDGSVSLDRSPAHQYSRPGTYVVVVESYFQKRTKIARRELSVRPLFVSLLPATDGGVEVVNNGDHELDLSGMLLSGDGEFVFPKHSILLAGESMVVSSVSGPEVSLKDEFGKPLAIDFKSTMNSNAVARIGATTKPSPAVPVAAVIVETPASSSESQVVRNIATVVDSDLPRENWPYLGLLAVIAIGFVALLRSKQG